MRLFISRTFVFAPLLFVVMVGCASSPPPRQTTAVRRATASDIIGCMLAANGCSTQDTKACRLDGNVGSPTFGHAGRCVPHQFSTTSICSVVTTVNGQCVYDGPCVELTPVDTVRQAACP